MAEQINIDIVAHDKTSSVIQGIFQGIGMSFANFAMQIPGAIMDFGASIVKEAAEAQQSVAQLEAVLKSTGGAAGMTKDELTGLADELSKVTMFSDDAIIGAENLLLTFTNIGEETFPTATKAILDMSTAFNQDLKSSAIQLGKALNDPINGVSALTRIGIQFTDEQKNMIESMVKTGDVAGAQALILEEVNKQVGGSAEAMGKTFGGQMTILNNRFGEIKETLGMALLPLLTQLLDEVVIPIMPAVEAAAKSFAAWLGTLSPFADRIEHVVSVMAEYLMPVFNALSQWWTDNGAIILMNSQMLWDDMWSGITGIADTVIAYLMPVFQGIADWWSDNSPGIMELASTLWTTISDGVKQIWEKILKPFIEENLPKLARWWEENSPRIIEALNMLAEGFQTALPVIIDLVAALLPVLSGLLDATLNAVQMILQLITGDFAGAWETAKRLVSGVVEAISEAVYNLAVVIVKALGFEESPIIETWTNNFNQMYEIAVKIFDMIIASVDNLVGAISDKVSEMFSGIATTVGRLSELTVSGLGLSDSGQRAKGGSVAAGGSYLVGEQGAEMFVPAGAGTIIPNGKGGGGNISVVLNYSPSVSLGSRQEAENTLLPYILSGIRAAQSNGLLATV